MLPKGFTMAHHKQRDPYTLKLLTEWEGKREEQDTHRETDKQTQTPNSFLKSAATGALCFLATKTKENKWPQDHLIQPHHFMDEEIRVYIIFKSFSSMKYVSGVSVAKHGIISTIMLQIDFFFFSNGLFHEALLISQKPITHQSSTECYTKS